MQKRQTNVRKSAWNLLVLGLTITCLVGCNTLGGERSSKRSFWSRNLANKLRVVKRDATDAYRTFDRHFWNQDWDDPEMD